MANKTAERNAMFGLVFQNIYLLRLNPVIGYYQIDILTFSNVCGTGLKKHADFKKQSSLKKQTRTEKSRVLMLHANNRFIAKQNQQANTYSRRQAH